MDRDDFAIIDLELPANASKRVDGPGPHELLLPEKLSEHVVAYAYQGAGTVAGTPLRPQQAAVLNLEEAVAVQSNSDAVAAQAGAPGGEGGGGGLLSLQATDKSVGFGVLLFAGQALDEPVAWRGPIVMNTQQEIRKAYSELRQGTFLRKQAPNYRSL